MTNGVAVVADNFWRAKEALHAMPIDWDFGPAGSTDSASSPPNIAPRSTGRSPTAAATAMSTRPSPQPAKMVEALYEVPYLAHAPMEPLNATAHWRADRIDVWMGTQAPESALALAAKAGGVDPKARLRPQLLPRRRLRPARGQRRTDPGGRGLQGAQASGQADLDARRGHPHRPLSPAGGAAHARRLCARTARPPAFDFRTAVGSITRSLGWGKAENGVERQAVEGLANCPYRSDALKVGVNLKNTHVPVMFWRSVGSSQNAFAVESFIDEMRPCGQAAIRSSTGARCSRAGPISSPCSTRSRTRATGASRCRKASGAASRSTRRSARSSARSPRSRSATSGEVKVQRVVACVDCGHLVNPLTVAMQIESAVIYGLTAALFGEITIKQGRVEQGNFDAYPIARMADAPVIETHFVLSRRRQMGRPRRTGHAADRARDRQRRSSP